MSQSAHGPLAVADVSVMANADLEIYPNPVLTSFKLRSKTFVKEITVYNLAGSPVAKFQYRPGISCDVSNLPKGLYLVQFIGSREKVVATRRLRKE